MPRSKPYNQFPRDQALGSESLAALDWIVTQINQLSGQAKAPSGAGIQSLSVNTVDPTAATISSAGSRTFSVTTSIVAVLTTTTATFYWDGTNGSARFQVLRDDGTSFGPSITGSPVVLTGLSPSTKYFVYPYFDESAQVIKFVPGALIGVAAVGTPGIAFTSQSPLAVQQQILRGRIPLAQVFVSSGFTTPGAGTSTVSGGNGGGSGAIGTSFLP